MRLIDADAINTKTFVDFVGNQGYISFGDALWMISKLPAVDAVPVVRGEWIPRNPKNENCYRYCSNCKADIDVIKSMYYKFCPECGADMRGEK